MTTTESSKVHFYTGYKPHKQTSGKWDMAFFEVFEKGMGVLISHENVHLDQN